MFDLKSLPASFLKTTAAVLITALIHLITPYTIYANTTLEHEYSQGIHNSIVQVYTVSTMPHYESPWVEPLESSAEGTGFVIDGNRILTNAHVVANQKSVAVRKSLKSEKYSARVLFVSHDADLAVLTVKDNSFFSGTMPLNIGTLPRLETRVNVYGFPEGETLTVTEGVLSGFDRKVYLHNSTALLAGEIMSDIRTGNSGSPVLAGNSVAGIIMQASKSGNIAHMVPAPIINQFLADISDGHYDGLPDLGLVTVRTNPVQFERDYCNLSESRGVLVDHIKEGSPAEGKILRGDLILSVDEYNIAEDGTVEYGHGKRTDFSYVVNNRQVGDTVSVRAVRSGKEQNITMTLDKSRSDYMLIPGEQYDRQPRYFIFGGLVFSPLTKNIINSIKDVPEEMIKKLSSWPTRDKKELVIVLMTLPDEVNSGYHHLNNSIISEVNGRPFKDFNELYNIVNTSFEHELTFTSSGGDQITIDRIKARERHKLILQKYSIRKDCSPDLDELHASSNSATVTR